VRKQDLDLLTLASRDPIVGSLGDLARDLSCSFVHMTRHLADVGVWAAALLQRAICAIVLRCPINDVAGLSHKAAGLLEVPPPGCQMLAVRAAVAVVGFVEHEVRAIGLMLLPSLK